MAEQQNTAKVEQQPKSDTASEYKVLARKYRSQTFSELIGQDALVRTLTHALETGRIHHAYMLTGIRGTGKTSTARIIAKALNCIGTDGNGKETPEPCGKCDNCKSITSDRHVDVIEMDAASHTGVDDMRDIIDSVRYAPIQARHKVYIIDEVHMLSKSAFNALLKTLEEPPPHVVFIFATTEIRKVPPTVLSRCQRFDLKRVTIATLSQHYKNIAEKEGVTIDDEALNLIARSADGSVRDGLSLLDQAIAQTSESHVSTEAVNAMLGLADRTLVFTLIGNILRGNTEEALSVLSNLYTNGADAEIILQDLLDSVHLLTRIKTVPSLAESDEISMVERQQATELLEGLSLPALTRIWQMLLKGVSEINMASYPMKALEMLTIRTIYAGTLPTPEEMLNAVSSGNLAEKKTLESGVAHKSSVKSVPKVIASPVSTPVTPPQPSNTNNNNLQQAAETAPPPKEAQNSELLEKIYNSLKNNNETFLASQFYLYVSSGNSINDKNITLYIDPSAPKGLQSKLSVFITKNPDCDHEVTFGKEKTASTLKEIMDTRRQNEIDKVSAHPALKPLLESISSYKITSIIENI